MEVDLHQLSPSNCSVNWPSKSSVLETPERKRFQHSISFVDSGLGSSLYNTSPNQVSMKPMKTSPLLRTPTDRSNRSAENLCCNVTPSPIKSFVHMSSYSSAFSSPEVRKCSVSKHELRLSNPENATSYQFSGISFLKNRENPINMVNGDIVTHGRPLAVKQYHAATPSTSRAPIRALVFSSSSGVEGIENDEAVADVTIPYTLPQTPSKGFEFDSMDKSMFGADDFFEIPTSTPLRDIGDNNVEGMPFPMQYPRLFEQASGPLEGSICDSFEVPAPSSAIFVSPGRMTLNNGSAQYNEPNPAFAGGSTNCTPDSSSQDAFLERSGGSALKKEAGEQCGNDVYMGSGSMKTFESSSVNFEPFQPPTEYPEPFSSQWSTIVFGDTCYQRELTKYAHSFLEAHSSDSF
uniref:Protein aurora borealis n=1 Tax=Syphacia muris TaxID=451379 RepID=A0A0N5B127_9BILA